MFIAVLVVSVLLEAVQRLLVAWKVPNTLEQQASMQQEVARLKRQAVALSTPETFAQSAKTERKAIALEKQLARLAEEQAIARSHYLLGLAQLGRLALVMFVVVHTAVHTTLTLEAASLPPHATWPLGRWLTLGTGKLSSKGAVGLLPWTIVCQRVGAALLGR